MQRMVRRPLNRTSQRSSSGLKIKDCGKRVPQINKISAHDDLKDTAQYKPGPTSQSREAYIGWADLTFVRQKLAKQFSKITAYDNQKDTDKYRHAARANRCCRQSAVRDTLLPVSLARSLRQQQNLVVIWQRVDCCVGYGRTMLTLTLAHDACGLWGLCWRLGYREVGCRCSLQDGHSYFRLCSSTTTENVFTGRGVTSAENPFTRRDINNAENLFTRRGVTSDENLFTQFNGNI